MAGPEAILSSLLDAYAARDADAMRAVLPMTCGCGSPTPRGECDPLEGSDLFVASLLSLEAPVFDVGMTQLVRVSDDQALTMLEVRAERNGRSLHNFTSFLGRVHDDRIAELWMVEALPAYSAEFWS